MINVLTHKLVQKYKMMSLPLKTSFWFFISSIIQKGITYLSTPIFTRLMSKESYGLVAVYNSWASMFAIIGTLQLASGVMNKALVKYSDDRENFTASMLTLSFASSTVLAICTLGIYSFFSDTVIFPKYMLFFMFLDTIFGSSMSLFSVRERFEYRYKTIILLSITANVLAIVVSLILVYYLSNKALARILGFVVVHAFFYSYAMWTILKRRNRRTNIKYWKYALRYNAPLIPHYFSQQVLTSADTIMIGALLGNEYTAVYSLSYQIAMMMSVVTNSIHATFVPWTFQNIKAGNAKLVGARTMQIVVCVAIMCLYSTLFAPELVYIAGGMEYIGAIYVIPPASMAVYFLMLYSFFANVEYYYEKTVFVMFASVIVAIVNIILNFIFIPIYGYVAAGYTTFASYALYSILHYLFMLKTCNEENAENPYKGKRILGISIIYVVASISVTLLYNYNYLRYGIIVVLTPIIVFFVYKRVLVFDKNGPSVKNGPSQKSVDE